jgi:putative transposase
LRAVPVRRPRVNDKRIDETTGERMRFSSAILPTWARKSPQVSEVLPLLYLHGLSTSDFAPALEHFLGSSHGLSAATITRLGSQWQDDAQAVGVRSLDDVDYVYLWVDGIHLKVRLEQDKVCLLVMIWVRADGTQGAGRPRRRVPRELGIVGRPAQGLQAPRHAGPDSPVATVRTDIIPPGRQARSTTHRPAATINSRDLAHQPG